MRWCVLTVGVLLLALSGCRQELETEYGQRKGIVGYRSVNGTAVLGEMFEQRGHAVFSWNSLSPRLQEHADVIVWFPDDFRPPEAEVCNWLDEWLEDKPGRTLIYVGRDFDAAPWYWSEVLPSAPADQRSEFLSEKSTAESSFVRDRSVLGKSESCPWFTIDGQSQPCSVSALQGRRAWTEGVDASQAAIKLNSRIVPADHAEALLRSGQDVLVSRQDRGEGQLIVVANGSFLLNAMLTNHENRKLAGRLIDEVGPPEKTVAFLESYAGGPPIRDDDMLPRVPTGMEIFQVWPTNWILLHLAIVGVIFCFVRYPIFGRPREPSVEGRSDFGKHIEAMAEMLERSGDATYAQERLLHYRETKADLGGRKSEKGESPFSSTSSTPGS